MVTSANSSSAFQPKLSAPGSAYVTGVAFLANPRRVPRSKTIVFDTQFYLGPTEKDLLIGSLRYFNSVDLNFDEGPDLYQINASFALRGPITDVPVSGQRTLQDYAFVGDIQSASDIIIHPLGPPGPRFLEGPPGRSPSEDNDFQTFTIDPWTQPYVYVTGVAMERSKAGALFEIAIEQYVSCVRSDPLAKKGDSRSKPTTTFLCHIPDSAKFKSWGGKPMPGNKRFVSVCGFLTGVEKSGHSEVEQFLIEVESVTFCGHYVQPVTSPVLPSPSSPEKSTALFSYRPPESPPQTRQRRNQGA